MKAFTLRLLSLAVASGCAFPLAHAEPAPPPAVHTLDRIDVNALRQSADGETGREIVTLDEARIRSQQAQSVAELIRYEPNVVVSGGPRPGLQSISIRGLGEDKVLQVVDGVRQDFNSGHRPSYFLDPLLLKRLEVVKGPVSSVWGSGALGGVVSQQTIAAEDVLQAGANFGGFTAHSHNSNNRERTHTLALGARTDRSDWLLAGSLRQGDDPRLGNGQRLENAARDDQTLLLKGRLQVDEAQSVGLNLRQARVDGRVPSNGAVPPGTSNFLINRAQHTGTVALDYHLDPASDWVNTRVTLSRNQVAMDESRVSDGRFDQTDAVTHGLVVTNESRLGQSRWLYGLDGYRERFQAQRSGSNRPQPPDAVSLVAGAFVQADLPLHEDWQLTVGTRYDRFDSEARNLPDSGKQRDDQLSPAIGLHWQATPWLGLALRHDRAFRAPTAEERFSSGAHFCLGPIGCNRFVPNPDLRPEKAANTELQARLQWADVLAADTVQVSANLFQNRVRDFIEQVVTPPSNTTPFPGPPNDPGTTTFVNVDQARLRGFEVTGHYARDHFQARLAYGQVRGEEERTGRALANVPADKLTLDLSRQWGQQLTTGVRVIRASSQDNTPDGSRFDGYVTGDIYASWQPLSVPALTLSVTVNNVSDRFYRQAFAQLDEPGREIIAALRYAF